MIHPEAVVASYESRFFRKMPLSLALETRRETRDLLVGAKIRKWGKCTKNTKGAPKETKRDFEHFTQQNRTKRAGNRKEAVLLFCVLRLTGQPCRGLDLGALRSILCLEECLVLTKGSATSLLV